MFKFALYHEVVRRCMETFLVVKSVCFVRASWGWRYSRRSWTSASLRARGRQSSATWGGEVRKRLLRLTLPNSFVIKRLRALHIVMQLCEGAYSAVAQWQSIRLLTEGL